MIKCTSNPHPFRFQVDVRIERLYDSGALAANTIGLIVGLIIGIALLIILVVCLLVAR